MKVLAQELSDPFGNWQERFRLGGLHRAALHKLVNVYIRPGLNIGRFPAPVCIPESSCEQDVNIV